MTSYFPNYHRWQGVRGEEYHPHAHPTSLQMSGRGQLSPSHPQDKLTQISTVRASSILLPSSEPIGGHAASTDELAAVLGPLLMLEDTGLMEVKLKTRSGFPSTTELPSQGHEDRNPRR